MKGFLGTFIIFMLWTSICFYYINIVEIGDSINTTPDIITNTSNTPYKEQEQTPDSFNNTNTSFTHIDSTESKRIADEIEKSISISDTAHIDKENSTHKLNEEITTTSTTLRPFYNGSELVLDKVLENFATNLKETIDIHPDKKITIIGHTDSIGSHEENLTEGLKKASQVRWYLIAKKNISDSKITAISKGEENPIEDNNTSTGRALNNRIEIIVN